MNNYVQTELTPNLVDLVYDSCYSEKYFQNHDETSGFWPKETLQRIAEDRSGLTISVVGLYNQDFAGFGLARYNPILRKGTYENLIVSSNYRNKKLDGRIIVSRSISNTLLKKLQEQGAEFVDGIVESENLASRNHLQKHGFDFGEHKHLCGYKFF